MEACLSSGPGNDESQRMRRLIYVLTAVVALIGCGPNEQRKAELAEEKRIVCLDKICDGDVQPPIERGRQLFKVNGQWFSGPWEYGNPNLAPMAFYWPSKTPLTGRADRQSYPERGKNFYDVAIQISLRSSRIPIEPRGYQLIELAESNRWIEERKTLRPGLEAITMKHVIGPGGHYIDHVTYYVATQLKGPDGLPPVATCSHADSRNGGGTGFMWRPGIWAGAGMNQKHCADWPEIYLEVTRVLQLIKKI